MSFKRLDEKFQVTCLAVELGINAAPPVAPWKWAVCAVAIILAVVLVLQRWYSPPSASLLNEYAQQLKHHLESLGVRAKINPDVQKYSWKTGLKTGSGQVRRLELENTNIDTIDLICWRT